MKFFISIEIKELINILDNNLDDNKSIKILKDITENENKSYFIEQDLKNHPDFKNNILNSKY